MATRADIEELIARTALRDRAAFSRLYELTSAKLFGICLRILNSRPEAEDALQEVFVKVWRNADRYKAGGFSPMTWLITIARNHAIDRLRARRAKGEGLDKAEELPDGAPGPEAMAIASSERGRLVGCLDELPEDRASAVRLAYLHGETYADLADRFGVPLNTMRTWLRRSLLKLRECLER
ncbi:sigma-70 family RNA polymerase sigma factor [Pseudooceanicola sp. 216_PA32_1]|uniref:Sigma-70 family RNA polymerase sigma factor n=1 Tax=Pseudooceanicola pacificus TaxID=2676438 RepID=A0A844W8X0_9RHOB|nr:sigma-70 family RNA polymerase sigma factor [Pseudooceanicola pacificus]MWB79595.1 sigma-70 family RNA polymerase sigma factor [Pseudooceanicola pacificus]